MLSPSLPPSLHYPLLSPSGRNVDNIMLSYMFHKVPLLSPSGRNVDNITLSYMFHKVDDEDLDDYEDDGAPTVVKVHAGNHAPMAAGGHVPSPAQLQLVPSPSASPAAPVSTAS